ncbi:hypothetical protein WMY93_013391 [Mugilogobius chulae]|uniref:Uncharacterized protein n=1 Tax=Mugilogobius chulae TaxID=88201 RepID=A0AAW0P3H7_9GOBI
MVSLICTLQHHRDDVNWCAFSATLLATCSGDKTLRVYNTKDFSEQPFSPLTGHGYGVHCCCFSPCGQFLASCSTDATVVIWSMVSGEIEAVLEHPGRSPVRVCALSPNSTHLVSGASDGSLALTSAGVPDHLTLLERGVSLPPFLTIKACRPDSLLGDGSTMGGTAASVVGTVETNLVMQRTPWTGVKMIDSSSPRFLTVPADCQLLLLCVQVNGERVAPPLSPADGVSITMNSKQVQLTTASAHRPIRWETARGASTLAVILRLFSEIILPSTYKNHVRGLCGNYDGITRNEYMKPDGTVTRKPKRVRRQLESERPTGRRTEELRLDSECPSYAQTRTESDPDSGFETSDCTSAELNFYSGSSQCGAVSNPAGPFSACHSLLPPKTYQDDCVFDLCAEEGSNELRCASYEAYAAACQEAGANVGAWRKDLGCALSCGGNSTYSSCMTSCPASCADLAAPSECDSAMCTEGLWMYFPQQILSYCSETCECTTTESCVSPKPAPRTVCTIFDFKRDCYRVSPCLSYPCLNGGTCTELSNSSFSCQCPEGFVGAYCEGEETPNPGQTGPS